MLSTSSISYVFIHFRVLFGELFDSVSLFFLFSSSFFLHSSIIALLRYILEGKKKKKEERKEKKKAKGKKYRGEKFGKSKRKKMVIADAVLFVRKQISRARGSIQIVAVFI